MKVTAIIEKGTDGLYAVYVMDQLPGFGLSGQGASVEEAKQELLLVYNEIKEIFAEEGKEIPELEIQYQYDLQSLFNYFDWINVSKLAKHIGVNAALLRHYKNGIAFASEKQCMKIQQGLRQIAEELMSAKF